MERDFNHPAIIGWCPFNETWGYREEREKNALLTSLYKLTKRLDPTRPCIDSSGNYRVLSESTISMTTTRTPRASKPAGMA